MLLKHHWNLQTTAKMLGGGLFLSINLIIVHQMYTLNSVDSTNSKKANLLLLSSVAFFGKIPKYFKHKLQLFLFSLQCNMLIFVNINVNFNCIFPEFQLLLSKIYQVRIEGEFYGGT